MIDKFLNESPYLKCHFNSRLLVSLIVYFLLNNIFVLSANCLKIDKNEKPIDNKFEYNNKSMTFNPSVKDKIKMTNYLKDKNIYYNKSDAFGSYTIDSLSSESNKTISSFFNNTNIIAVNNNNLTSDDKVDADIGVLDKKLENLSKMLENLENIKSSSKDEAKLSNITSTLSDTVIPSSDSINTTISKEIIVTNQKEPIEKKEETNSIPIIPLENKAINLEVDKDVNIIDSNLPLINTNSSTVLSEKLSNNVSIDSITI